MIDTALAAFRHGEDCTALDGRRLTEYTGSRGDPMVQCRACRRAIPIARLVAPEPRPRAGRYWLACCRCEADIWCSSQRPRLPLCAACMTRHQDHRRTRRPHREERTR